MRLVAIVVLFCVLSVAVYTPCNATSKNFRKSLAPSELLSINEDSLSYDNRYLFGNLDASDGSLLVLNNLHQVGDLVSGAATFSYDDHAFYFVSTNVSGSPDNYIFALDITSGQVLHKVQSASKIACVQYSWTDKLLYGVSVDQEATHLVRIDVAGGTMKPVVALDSALAVRAGVSTFWQAQQTFFLYAMNGTRDVLVSIDIRTAAIAVVSLPSAAASFHMSTATDIFFAMLYDAQRPGIVFASINLTTGAISKEIKTFDLYYHSNTRASALDSTNGVYYFVMLDEQTRPMSRGWTCRRATTA